MDNLSPDQIKAMITMLQTMLAVQSQVDNTESDTEENNDTPAFGVVNAKTTNSNQKTKQRPNKFNSMPEKNMHKEDIAIDQKLSVQPPVPRARPFKTLKVVCRVCGRNDEVNPSLLVEGPTRYKCNQCSTSAG